MMLFRRFIGLVVLAGFLGFTAAEWAHAHKELGATRATDCSVCKIAHQTPALTPADSVFVIHFSVLGSTVDFSPAQYHVFASTSHGLSPPAAL